MADLTNKTCPYIQSTCLMDQCAWFEERLQNCSVQVLTFNMYKLENALRTHPIEPRPVHPHPFPPQPRS